VYYWLDVTNPRERYMPISIRIAQKDDVDLLVHFNSSLAEETEATSLNRATVKTGVEAALADPQKGFYLIAELDDRPAGGLLVTTEWSDWRNAMFWWIQSVYVEKDFRQRGVYKALHRHVEKLAREDVGVCGIRLYVDHDNSGAQATYEKLGMQPGRYRFYETKL